MGRIPMVLAALAFGMGAAFAQSSGTTTSGGTSGSATSGTTDSGQPTKPKKKKGREWGRFSSQRVETSQTQPPPPKVGVSPRLE